MSEYRLRFWGDPVLSTPATDVVVDDLPADLIPAMRRILAEQNGLGLAAQQVGATERVALMRIGGRLVTAINLRITERSHAVATSPREGCLSVQSETGEFYRVNMPRHAWVVATWHDEDGTLHTRRLEGMDAIVAQHEADHLDGICIADGLSRQQRRHAERVVGTRAIA